jgi:putative acetyltransferase
MKDDVLIEQIRSASRDMIRQFGLLEKRYSSIGTVSQCHALVEIDIQGVMNLGELSSALNLEKSTTSRLIAQMIQAGLCTMQADENDRRNKLLSLTKKGMEKVKIIHSETTTQLENALTIMNDEEQSVVARGLSLFVKFLKRSSLQSEYKIRRLKIKDLPQLIHLTKKIWSEFGFDKNHPDAPLFESELRRTYEIYSAKKSAYFILEHKNKIVGGAGYAPLTGATGKICELKGMYLSNQTRGLGLGASLLQYVLNAAKKEGFKQCYLETMDYMHGANSLYQKTGFKRLKKPRGKTGHTWTNRWYIINI